MPALRPNGNEKREGNKNKLNIAWWPGTCLAVGPTWSCRKKPTAMSCPHQWKHPLRLLLCSGWGLFFLDLLVWCLFHKAPLLYHQFTQWILLSPCQAASAELANSPFASRCLILERQEAGFCSVTVVSVWTEANR